MVLPGCKSASAILARGKEKLEASCSHSAPPSAALCFGIPLNLPFAQIPTGPAEIPPTMPALQVGTPPPE